MSRGTIILDGFARRNNVPYLACLSGEIEIAEN